MPIVGLHDMKKDDDDDDDDDRNELYTGGTNGHGGGSGMAVLGPDSDDEGGSLKSHVGNMFSQAKQNASGGSTPSDNGAPKRVITMYSNGFTVDDGPFRSLDDPANQSFVRDVARGLIPRELEAGAKEGAFNLELQDKRGETYTAPSYVAFSGGGQALSSSDATSDAAVLGSSPSVPAPVVDDSAPKTTLQIRLANGKRMRATLNLTHTIRHLDALIRSEGGADAPYTLLAGYPPAPLADLDASIDAAGLKGASVTQKLA